MAEAIAERVRRYILDGGDEDLRRLLGVAETTQEMARSAFRKAGMQEGWHAIDCGCGPIGGLAVMAEMVGPAGRVVGVDFSEPATLLAARERAVASGFAAGQQIDDLANDLRAAKGGGYEWVSMPFFLDLTLRKPLAPEG